MKRILVVDDSQTILLFIQRVLSKGGYKVDCTDKGSVAVSTYEATRADLVILDVVMQGMDGLETTRRIRQMEATSGQRNMIIGVTAHALAGDREHCLAAGMDEYISKPIHPDILASKLSQRPLAA